MPRCKCGVVKVWFCEASVGSGLDTSRIGPGSVTLRKVYPVDPFVRGDTAVKTSQRRNKSILRIPEA